MPQLYDAVPNRANDETLISYYLPVATKVGLKVYDLQGRLVDQVDATNLIGFNNVKYSTAKLQVATYIISSVRRDEEQTTDCNPIKAALKKMGTSLPKSRCLEVQTI